MPSFAGFVPTSDENIDIFLALAGVSSSDVVYDLGSGDGKLLFAALDKGARKAVGVELDPELVRSARETARNKGLEERVTFLEDDVMAVPLTEASIVLCYLGFHASEALKPKFEAELEPATRVVMESFPVPGWESARSTVLDMGCCGHTWFYLYIMPPHIKE